MIFPPRFALLILAFSALCSSTAFSQIPSRRAEAKDKTVVDMTAAELLKSYHKELSHLEFSLNQEPLDYLLRKVGDNVENFFRNFANTSSRERIYMRKQYVSEPQLQRPERSDTLFKEFHYLILPHSGSAGNSWVEDRADKDDRPVNQKVISGFIMSSGYVALCMYLHPSQQANSHFRYLGRETKKPRAHVIAFAQKPQSRDCFAQNFYVVDSVGLVRILVQGFVWLDPDSYEILRMRTSMLLAEKQTGLRETTSDIYYEPVKFDTQQQFWLPRVVDVSWEFPGLIFRNQHKYSDYHLFSVESDYKLTQPKVNK